MNENTVIEITGLKKKYKLGTIGGGTLRGEIQSRIALKLGKDDPNAKIGQTGNYNKEFWAVDGIDLHIERGERVGIIGHNGAGKSTMLKMLSRITAPTEGKISIRGRITSMLEVGTGFHGELTGRENIYLNAAILGMTKEEVDEKIDDIIAFSECEEFIDTPVKRYSSGMYVKLAFSVAAHLDSEIMIMDEVLAVGDVNFQDKCIGKMLEVALKENRTILYVSHNMATIRKLCERCVVLDHGQIIYDGDVNKAIDIYVAKDAKKNGKFEVDAPRSPGEKGRFIAFDLLENDEKAYEQNDVIRARVGVRAFEDLQDMHIRFIIKYMDSSNAGTFFSKKFNIVHDIDCYYNVELPLTVLPEGEFYIRIVFSHCDLYRTWVDYASVEQAEVFSVRGCKDNYLGMNWREGWRNNYGTVALTKCNDR